GTVVEKGGAVRNRPAEGRGEKGGMGQKPREPIGDLRQSIGQRRRFERRAAVGAEFIERVSHGSLSVPIRSLPIPTLSFAPPPRISTIGPRERPRRSECPALPV